MACIKCGKEEHYKNTEFCELCWYRVAYNGSKNFTVEKLKRENEQLKSELEQYQRR